MNAIRIRTPGKIRNNKSYGYFSRKVVFAVLGAALIFGALFPLFPVSAETGTVNKDETVYGFLDTSGSVKEVRVVNRLIRSDGGTWVDWGNYLSVRAMETDLAPDFSPGRVVWDLSGMEDRDFYYEGVMNQALPLKAATVWKLDGTAVQAETLSGASGTLEWTLSLGQDTGLQQNLRDRFLTQVQLSLDLDKASFLEAKNATVTVTGHMATIVWTMMPGESGIFSFHAVVKDFSMEPVALSLVKYLNPVAADVTKLTDGVKKMEDAGTQLVNGTDELATGLGSLNDGIAAFTAGLTKLEKGALDLTKGLGEYATGMDSFGNGLVGASDGLTKVSAGFAGLRNSSTQLLAGQAALLSGLRETAAGHAKLVQLANALVSSPDPMVQQLAGGVIAEQAGLDKLVGGLEQQVAGLTQFNAGLAKAIDGLNATVLGVAGLPAASDPSGKVISFADGKTAIHSLQYVLRMDGIPAPDKAMTEGPIEMRIPWYEELWNRVTGLFGA